MAFLESSFIVHTPFRFIAKSVRPWFIAASISAIFFMNNAVFCWPLTSVLVRFLDKISVSAVFVESFVHSIAIASISTIFVLTRFFRFFQSRNNVKPRLPRPYYLYSFMVQSTNSKTRMRLGISCSDQSSETALLSNYIYVPILDEV